MDFHSTAVTIIDVSPPHSESEGGEDIGISGSAVDILPKLQHLQANHVWLRQRLTDWQRQALTERLARQRRIYIEGAKLEKMLRTLQAKYNRKWHL
ncbi:uncharacterized protein [Drosophila tropicalis]|uniref:uncharacterized protein n=1 Tax=Drosophila tropicalis TaxID=46794 RepID=UPI0035AC0A2F